MFRRWPWVGLLLATMTPSCFNTESLGVKSVTLLGPGVINDPKNKTLRFDVLKYGLKEFCSEMTQRGISLKLGDDNPILGRFFASDCQTQIIDEEQRKSLIVQFSGRGYAWTNVTQRLGFKLTGLAEFSPDFQVADDGAMYVYFRPKNVSSNTYEQHLVESALTQGAMVIAGVDPNAIGKKVVEGQLSRGFTVIRYDERGAMDFSQGFLNKGERPFHPFQIVSSSKALLANDRTEIHAGQQDYIGGFEVKENNQALTVTLTVDGTTGVDVFLVDGTAGSTMIDTYIERAGTVALPSYPRLEDVALSGSTWQRTIAVPQGHYYLVIDNSAQVGRIAPPQVVGDDRAAKVDYAVQLGDAP